MSLAVERQHMVLAHREEVYVLHDNHLVVLFLEKSIREHLVRVLLIAPCEHFHGLSHSHRSLLQAITRRVFAEQSEHFVVSLCQLLEQFHLLGGVLLFCCHISFWL